MMKTVLIVRAINMKQLKKRMDTLKTEMEAHNKIIVELTEHIRAETTRLEEMHRMQLSQRGGYMELARLQNDIDAADKPKAPPTVPNKRNKGN